MKAFTLVAVAMFLASMGACRDESGKDREQLDQGRLAKMRQEIIERIGEATCSGDGECEALALGSKPCGGPREYLVYSTASIDTEELQELADEYTRLDAQLNARYGYVSDCMVVTPPEVECIDDRCVVVHP